MIREEISKKFENLKHDGYPHNICSCSVCVACRLIETLLSECERLEWTIKCREIHIKELEKGIEGVLNQKDLISFSIEKQLEEIMRGGK